MAKFLQTMDAPQALNSKEFQIIRICHPGLMNLTVEFRPRKPVGTGYLRTLFSGMKPNLRKMSPLNFQYKPSEFMRVFLITFNFLLAYTMIKAAVNIASL